MESVDFWDTLDGEWVYIFMYVCVCVCVFLCTYMYMCRGWGMEDCEGQGGTLQT